MNYVTFKGLASFSPEGSVHRVEMDYHANGVVNYIIDGVLFADEEYIELYWQPGYEMNVVNTELDLSDIPF